MFKKINAVVVAVLFAAITVPATRLQAAQGSQWNKNEIIKPHQLIKMLSSKSTKKPLVLQVGFQFLYEGGHIDGAKWAGPASRPDGIQRLEAALKNVPKNRSIVIYCGCCPWSECPNVLPAFKLMKQMGYTHVKALYIPINFERDWISKGYPITKGDKPGPR